MHSLPLSLQGEIADLPRFCLFYISFGLELIALVLSAFADVPREAEDLVKKNPEVGAAFLSRITFNWFNSMVLNGFKRPLVQEDMWELSEAESTLQISQRFQQTMQTELKAARTRLQTKIRKRGEKASKGLGEGLQNGHQNSLGKGVSQDVLMMEEKGDKKDKKKEKKKKKEEEKEDYPESWLIPTIATTFKGVLWESAFFKLLTDLLSFASPQILK
ncbi:unnamed protein product [Coregonus sp. 'balchen']|nr:unnamed protein product [Coregonus sp. 'balchen']